MSSSDSDADSGQVGESKSRHASSSESDAQSAAGEDHKFGPVIPASPSSLVSKENDVPPLALKRKRAAPLERSIAELAY